MLPMDSSATAQVLRIFGTQPIPAYAATLELPVQTVGVTDPDTGSLAMPVFGVGGMLAGALTVAAPSTRLTPPGWPRFRDPLEGDAVDRALELLSLAG